VKLSGTLAALAVLLGTATAGAQSASSATSAPAPGSAAPGACAAAIPPASAQTIFDKLAPLRESDGCVLDRVDTDRSEMKVIFEKGGSRFDPVLVAPLACATPTALRGKSLAYRVPASLPAACPATVKALTDVMGSESVSTVPLDTHGPSVPRWRWFAAGGVAALLFLVVVLMGRRPKTAAGAGGDAPKPSGPSGDPPEAGS
jgi:hypothetical protein